MLSGYDSNMKALSYILFGTLIGMYAPKLMKGYRSSSSRKSEKAWVLTVTLTFQNMEDRDMILDDWSSTVVPHCSENEPFLLHYEAGISDKDPLKVIMLERYTEKSLYLTVHKSSEAFLKFRPKLKALQDGGKVAVEGFSYQEGGYGFTS